MKQVYRLAFIILLAMWSCRSTDTNEDAWFSETEEMLPFTESVTITFDEPNHNFKAGDYVYKVKPDGCGGKVYLYAQNPRFPYKNAAMIFDSSNPTGEDWDLGTPNEGYGGPGRSEDGIQDSNQEALGNILIITEDFSRRDPDDSFIVGSYYEFNFTKYGDGYVTMESFLLIDVDEESLGEATVVNLYGKDDELLFTKPIPLGQDNEVRLIDLENTEGVERMVINLNNSGAIDNITFTCNRQDDFQCQRISAGGESALCFIDEQGISTDQWGWTNLIQDGYEGTLELWMGAAGCDISNGVLAGELFVSYKDCVLEIRFEMLEGFYLTEALFYAGEDKFPKDANGNYTIDPEAFSLIQDIQYATEGAITIDDLKGDIYLIAGGSVCRDVGQ